MEDSETLPNTSIIAAYGRNLPYENRYCVALAPGSFPSFIQAFSQARDPKLTTFPAISGCFAGVYPNHPALEGLGLGDGSWTALAHDPDY